MTPAIADIRDFLSVHHPFDLLPISALDEAAAAVEIVRAAKGTVLWQPGDRVAALYVVRSGAAETLDGDGQLLARMGEGECFGVRALLRDGVAVNRTEIIEDCELWLLPQALVARLRADHPPLSYFFAMFDGGRIGDAMKAGAKEMGLLSMRIQDVLSRAPVTAPGDITVQDAARRMREHKVSALMLTAPDGALAGILTDRDLRSRVVAEGLALDTPVAAVMSHGPRCIEATDLVFEAMLAMSRHNIHHLPVLDHGRVVGCLTTSTVADTHTHSPLFLAKKIHLADATEGLRAVTAQIPALVEDMAAADATAQSIGRVVSALTDAVTERLLALAEARLGPPPVPYVWMAAGSQARQEQTALSDQDNCMILADAYDEAAHGDYFRTLATFVTDGLNACGYVYCPGEMMARTDQWRRPLAAWREYFRKWIDEPQPKALMLSSVFFDLRAVHGDAGLFEDLHRSIVEKSQRNRIFQAHMAHNALTHRPPLGFFRNLVLASGGGRDHTLDLKHNGIVPIVDLARVHGLAAGVPAVNTFERIEAAGAAKALSQDGAADLRDALEFISIVRLRHQARCIREGRKPDNFASPDDLSSFDRSHLKAAFNVIKTLQSSLANTYQLSRF
ncbi:DUF294 nucleotidyltransferase-like domain-containing protein [Magnetospirillum sp. UT-4]|uniref:DUF294 nucleotidyltransferase-like domain-containing protein n=1 Tax=Magnetospirillum sp. UT-4 TaxID=2681467 RepID=UPI00137E61FD|nr:DUF294 nucleotidyltransferase-like domain-containing protein [Magnetospirillum sp. UT-4]CAA7616834.1 Cyclic nucleotide-binding protein [Magnetospirillum sp. UT-4]